MIYSGIITSKNGSEIPLFTDGLPMHSKYNPEREAVQFAEGITAGFALVIGIGGAYHIAALLKKNTRIHILAVEADRESLSFCRQIECATKTEKDSRVTYTDAAGMQRALRELYKPAVYGNLCVLFNRAWENENKAAAQEIRENAKRALEEISADYSVQSHFGKIWQENIIRNSAFVHNTEPCDADTSKTAAVIAAGPSLDNSFSKLRDNRDKYYIISTDTAFRALCSRGIKSDAVVSVDAQMVTTGHFMPSRQVEKSNYFKNTRFVMSLSSPDSAVRQIMAKGGTVEFVTTGHPLEALFIEEKKTYMPKLDCGAGTVTVAACDFARQEGFKKIELFGADFAFSLGKPYTRGTYLDANLTGTAERLECAEQKFASLMFRTELLSDNKKTTTTSLKNYARSLSEWAEKNAYFFIEENLLYSEKPAAGPRKFLKKNCSFYGAKDFIKKIQKELQKICSAGKEEFNGDNKNTAPFLPLVAWIRKNTPEGNNMDVLDCMKLAYKMSLRYNCIL